MWWDNPSFDRAENNKRSEMEGVYRVSTMKITLETINDKQVLTSNDYILYCPLAFFFLYVHTPVESLHRLGIVFPKQITAFLKLGHFFFCHNIVQIKSLQTELFSLCTFISCTTFSSQFLHYLYWSKHRGHIKLPHWVNGFNRPLSSSVHYRSNGLPVRNTSQFSAGISRPEVGLGNSTSSRFPPKFTIRRRKPCYCSGF